MEPIEKFKHQDLTVEISYDTDLESPRDYQEKLGIMVFNSFRNYTLGEITTNDLEGHLLDLSDYTGHWYNEMRGSGELNRIANRVTRDYYILPIGVFIHGDITIRESKDFESCDGIIYISKEDAKGEKMTKQMCLDYMRGEIKEYDSYLRGEVYAYKILDDENNVIESNFGFYELENCKETAIKSCESIVASFL